MNLIRLHFPSDALHSYVDVTVCLPKKMKTPLEEKSYGSSEVYPYVILLHGALDCGDSWLTHTDLEDLVDSTGIAAVLPSCGNSFYLDEPDGLSWFTYITEELPEYLQSILPLSAGRHARFIGGLSMGGYGALYTALKKPNLFGKVFSMSGAVDIRRTASFVSSCGASLPSHLRNRRVLKGSDSDLFALCEGADAENMPALFLSCGREDFLYGDNQNFLKALHSADIPYRWSEDSGNHDWNFWKQSLCDAFAFLTD